MTNRKRIIGGRIVVTSVALALFLGSVPRPALSQIATSQHPPFIVEQVSTADSLPPYVPGEVLVKFKKGTSASQKRGLHAGTVADLVSEIRDIGVDRVKSARGESTEVLLQRYRNSPLVEYAEPNFQVHTFAIPNDPRFSELWGLHNIGQSSGTVDADIDAPEAWDRQTGSQQVVVADVDTGLHATHADLAANIWTNPGEIPNNQIDDDGNGYVDDYQGWDFVGDQPILFDNHGHGTHTAGIIGAVGNNAIGVVGVSWRVKIMSVRFLDDNGFGDVADGAAAIVYAANMGARIANNSWGCGPVPFCYSQTLEDAIAYAESRGMLVVAAAGNNGGDNDLAPVYPCSSPQPNVICVAATDRSDQQASFSNWGTTSVDLSAPGVDVLSTVPTGGCSLCDASGYLLASGTSMAAPHVSGAAALLLSQFPSLGVAELKALLLGSVDSVGSDTLSGGRLNVDHALRTNFTVVLSPTERVIPPGGSATYTVTVTTRNGFGGPVTLSFSASDPSFSGTFSSSTVSPGPDGSVNVTLSVFHSGVGTAACRYRLMVQGQDPSGITGIGAAGITIGTDLAMESVSGPSEVSGGALVSVSDSVHNLGPLDWSSSFVVSYFLSDDPAITPNDVRIGGRIIRSFPAGVVSNGTEQVGIPLDIAPGTYFWGAIVDLVGVVPDLDRSNNSLAGGIVTVSAGLNRTPTLDWSALQSWGGGFSKARQEILAVDQLGNSVIVQPRFNGTSNDHDIFTTKIDSAGNQVWRVNYDSGGLIDIPVGIWIDGDNNIYVAGFRSSWLSGIVNLFVEPSNHQLPGHPEDNFLTIKYDPDGNLVWARQYDSGDSDYAGAISGDGIGNVYVTGRSYPNSGDFATIKYDPDGNVQWVRRYGGEMRESVANIAVDSVGNVYISGTTGGTTQGDGYATIKYNSSGTQLWVQEVPGGWVQDLAVDQLGNAYVTGFSWFDETIGSRSTSYDYRTIKYDPNGNVSWVRRYDHGLSDVPRALDVDGSGNVYVTGYSLSQYVSSSNLDIDFATVKYDSAGNQQWVARFDGGRDDQALDLALDARGDLYVTGSTCVLDCVKDSYVTLKYDQDGTQIWIVGNEDGKWPVAVVVDEANHVYLTGLAKSDSDYLTVRYTQYGFFISATPSLASVEPGSSASYSVTVHSANNFSGPVSLSCAPVQAEPSIGCLVSPPSVTPPPNRSVDVMVTVTTTSATPVGIFSIGVEGSAGSDVESTQVELHVGVSGMDLLMDQITPSTTAVPVGGSLPVTDSVFNEGLTATGTFRIYYRLSLNAVYGDADDVLVTTTRTVAGLAAGVTNSASTTLTVPATMAPGSYRVCAKADGDSVVNETDEGNNTLCSASTVTLTVADLILTALSPTATAVVPGGLFAVSTTVRNQGAAPAGAFAVEMHLSSDSTYGGSDDVALTPTRSVSSLAVGVSSSATTTLTVPGTTPFGPYFVCAMADSGQVINEGAFEGNNTACSLSPISVIADDARMINISTRAFVGTGTNVAVGGFIISGSGTKQVLLRGFGPTLTSFGITGALANPTLELYWDDDNNPSTPAILALSNDDWGTVLTACPMPVVACGTPQDIFNTGLSADSYAPTNPNRNLDAALLLTLPPGTYTARLSGVSNGTGVGLIGVDDVDTNQTATLINISTRAFVGTGSNVAVGGFIIGGTVNKQLLLRGFGPTLTSFGITGALANPMLDLYWDDDNNPNTAAILVLTNDNWGTALGSCPAPVVACGTPTDISNTGMSADTYAPSNPNRGLDAALLLTLPPGTYTARLSGVSNGTGVGLIGVDQVGP